MLVVTFLVICVCVVLTLALAASSSGAGGMVTAEDEHRGAAAKAAPAFKTSHEGVATESQPVVSAAGLQ